MAKRKNNNGVVFRRVRGRIVPIKLSKAQRARLNEGAAGAGIMAGGAAVGIGAGASITKAESFLNRKSARNVRASKLFKSYKANHRQMSLFGHSKTTKANLLLNKSRKRVRLGKSLVPPVKKFGKGAAAFLVGYGASKVVRATHGNKNETVDAVVGATVGAAAYNPRGTSEFLYKVGGNPKKTGKAAWRTAKAIIRLKTKIKL